MLNGQRRCARQKFEFHKHFLIALFRPSDWRTFSKVGNSNKARKLQTKLIYYDAHVIKLQFNFQKKKDPHNFVHDTSGGRINEGWK